ncbi:YjbF family lipoprotein [Enterobacter cloacae]
MYKKIGLAGAVILIGACSQHRPGLLSQTIVQSLSSQDAFIDRAKVTQVPYASMALTVADGPQAFIVLAWDEDNTQKWLTADAKMIATRSGRLIKTLGFSDNLLSLESNTPDPLADPLAIQEGQQWHAQTRWQDHGFHAANITSRFHWSGSQDFTVLDVTRSYRVLEEAVTDEKDGATWQQRYWVDPQSGRIVHSKQILHPHGQTWSLTLLKPYS